MKPRRGPSPTSALWALAIYFLVLSIGYNLTSPPFENPDELEHAQYSAFLSDHHRLPRLLEDCVRLSFHPPLYHALVAPIAAFTRSAYDGIFHGYHLNRGPDRDVVILTHGFADEAFPYSGSPRFIHLARLFTTIAALAVLFFCWRLAKLLFDDDARALLCVAFVATLPQFQYLSATLNHDALAAGAAAALSYYSTRVIVAPRKWDSTWIGMALAVGLLTKASILALASIPVSALVVQAASRQPMRDVAKLALPIVLIPLILAGWWYLREWSQFGSPFPMLDLVKISWVGWGLHRAEPFSLHDYWSLVDNVYRSFVFLGGMMHISAPTAVYLVWLPYVALAIVGLASCLVDRRTIPLAIGAICMMVSVVKYNHLVSSPQGRYLFPILNILSIAAVTGLSVLTRRHDLAVGRIYATVLSIAGLVCLFHLASLYESPPNRMRDGLGGTSRLFCANEYRQRFVSSGGAVSGFRLYGSAQGERNFTLHLSIFRGGSSAPARVVTIPASKLPAATGPIDVPIPELHLLPGEPIVLAVSAPSATPASKATLSYELGSQYPPFAVNDAVQDGSLMIEEVVAGHLSKVPRGLVPLGR